MIDRAMIDAVAVQMCHIIGVNPYESISVTVDAVWTTQDRLLSDGFIPGMALTVPRWQTYRGNAELAIAASIATQTLGITP